MRAGSSCLKMYDSGKYSMAGGIEINFQGPTEARFSGCGPRLKEQKKFEHFQENSTQLYFHSIGNISSAFLKKVYMKK